MSPRIVYPLYLLLCLVLCTTSTSASVGDRYGFLSSSVSLGGAKAGARALTSASAYENPAQLSLENTETDGNGRLHFHWSVLYAKPSFAKIENVVVENPVNSDTTRSDNVDTNYPATFGQSIGLSLQSKKSERRWGIGVVAYLPLDRLALVDSGESFVPEYTLYRSANQKPEFDFALSGRVTEKLSLGLGLQLGSKLDLGTTIFLNQGNGTASSMRISADLKTKATFYGGILFLPSETLSVGLTARAASSQPERLNVLSTARAIGTVSAPDFAFPAVSTMYYDPFTLQLGMEWKTNPADSLFLQLDYQAWSRFESPAIRILDPQTAGCAPNCGVSFSESRNLTPPTRDLWIPRVGYRWAWENQAIQLGYVFRKGIYRSLPSDIGNAIDPDEHRIAAGYGWSFSSLFAFDAPGRIDFHGMYSLYPKHTVVKSAGDENGNLANPKIGAPGYEIGGFAWGGGATLQIYLD